MQFRYLDTIQNSERMDDGKFHKVTAMSWSPNGMRLAVATYRSSLNSSTILMNSRKIFLYDEEGKERDRFNTKPALKNGSRNYLIRDIAFSPDSTLLAVAQSDNIVFVYKLGSTWGAKKTICNKFLRRVSVTCMCWPAKRPGEIVFGLADGQVMVGVLKNNKAFRLFSTESYVVSLAPSPSGHGFVCGHLDGNVHRYAFRDASGGRAETSRVFKVPFVPYCLAHGVHIAVAGNTGQVRFYTDVGEHVQTFTHTLQPLRDDGGDTAGGETGEENKKLEASSKTRSSIKEFSSARFNPAGHTVVFGNFSCFFTFVYNPNAERWNEAPITHIENLYTISAMSWRPDGSKLATGSLCGAVDLYDACIRRFRYRGQWEFTYTSASSLVVKTIATGETASVSSKLNYEITKSDIYAERYFVGRTPETLILCDLETRRTSEIEWVRSGKERFFFDNPTVCMVFAAGELSIVQYGSNEIIGQVRTEHMNPHLISTRISELEEKVQIKKVAFLLDQLSIRVLDLLYGHDVTVSHTARIDWLELNVKASKLLFRDNRRTLHLFDLSQRNDGSQQKRVTLLNFCDYVQWVPGSDAVVAQSRNILYVWYRIENSDQVVTREIKGDVEEIERLEEGKTHIIVNEGSSRATYVLDEDLIAFDSALDDMQLVKAMQILEAMDVKKRKEQKQGGANALHQRKMEEKGVYELGDSEKSREAMWEQLASCAIDANAYAIGARAYAALGDLSKSQYMSKLSSLAMEHGENDFRVEAQVAIYRRQFKKAEAIYMDNGRIDLAIDMHRRLFKWQDALSVANSQSHPSASWLAKEYYDYLISTQQQEIAGKLKEQEGDYMTALSLYLDGGYPSQAARVVTEQHLTNDSQLLEKVAEGLLKKQMYTQAGKFLEALKYSQRALSAYLQGNSFREAVALCKREIPQRVVELQEQWGDYMVRLEQWDAACAHFVEAGCNMKAIDAAIKAKQWKRAIEGLDDVDEKSAKPYLRRIADHYASVMSFEQAERHYIRGGMVHAAVRMYLKASLWDSADRVAQEYMDKAEREKTYLQHAKKLENEGDLKSAAHLYLQAKESMLAITMYKRHRKYDEMLELVKVHKKDMLEATHASLAEQFAREGEFHKAEKHYLAASKWEVARDMYKNQEMWEDALRVSKIGGVQEYKKTAFYFAISVGGDAGIKFLTQRGLGELAVQYAIENGEYTEAFHIAKNTCPEKLPEVHYQYALALEDEGHFERAEEEFINANKPKEAIDMYNHQRQWEAAMKVAENHDPVSIATIWEEKGHVAKDQKNYEAAENFYINAKKPQLAISTYKEAGMWDKALKVARNHAPHLVKSVQNEHDTYVTNVSDSGSLQYRRSQARLQQQRGKYSEAIDELLQIDEALCPNKTELSSLMDEALGLARDYVSSRVKEVSRKASVILNKMGEPTKAAKILDAASLTREAVDVLIENRIFDLARQYAERGAPQLLKLVDKRHQQQLMNEGNTDKLSQINPTAAMEMFIKKGDWPKVYQLANRQGKGVVMHCAAMHADSLVKKKQLVQAINVLRKYGGSLDKANIGLYTTVCRAVLKDPAIESKSHSSSIVPDSHVGLREVLYRLLEGQYQAKGKLESLCKYLRVVHLSALRRKCEELKLKDLVAHQCVALLRHTELLPVDVAFYHAGQKCKEEERMEMAFVFFNRFVDISDMIEDEEEHIDEAEFLKTDIPSAIKTVPKASNFDENTREEVREWALNAGMDKMINNELPLRTCSNCGTKTYEAGVTCHSCKHKSTECIITGLPVPRGSGCVSCPKCGVKATKTAWNLYVMKAKACPWCESRAVAVY